MPNLRNRSYGVDCQSQQQLFEVANSPSQIIESHVHSCPSCFNIDQLLKYQQTQQPYFCQESNYYFNQEDQMQQEEEEELTKPFQTPSQHTLVTTEIAIICQQLQQVLLELISKQKIKLFYSARYNPQADRTKLISVQIQSNTVRISQSNNNISEDNVSQSIVLREGSTCMHSSVGGAKLEEGLRNNQAQSKALQLVIYYNFVQQDHFKNRNSFSEEPKIKVVFQHKIWLIQKHEEYTPLLSAYANIPSFLFKTKRQQQTQQSDSRIIYEQIKPLPTNKTQENSSLLPDGILKDVLNRVENIKRQTK